MGGDGKSKYCPDSCRKRVGDSCGESNLDIMTVTALAEGVPAQFWIIKSGDPLDMFKQFNEDRDSALVVSCSFGDSEAQFDEDGGKRLETEFLKAGVAGKTILFAIINEHRLVAGQPPMGAINSFLYQHPEAF